MSTTLRPAPFITVATNHGTMIINRNDYHMVSETKGHGVGYQILNTSCYDQDEVFFVLELLKIRRGYYGDGVIAIDCGANYGVHTLEWARLMHNWGHVFSFEAQEKIFYALAGNIIMNNCLNVTARQLAIGREIGEIEISEPNYFIPGSYGSFELKRTENSEFIGQNIDFKNPNKIVSMISLDSASLNRIDLIKIDVEGMEEEVLAGALNIVKNLKPILSIEVIKSDKNAIEVFLQNSGYIIFPFGLNILAIHETDMTLKHVSFEDNYLSIQ